MTDHLEKYRAIVEKMYDLTVKRQLHWSINPFDDELYAQLGSYRVVLKYTEDSEGSPLIGVYIKKLSGEVVDHFYDTTIAAATPRISDIPSYWRMMEALYSSAHRFAMGADAALDEILKALDDEEAPF